MKTPLQPHALLDYLIAQYKLGTDAELARRTEFGRATISRFRNGAEVSPSFKLALYRAFKMNLKQINTLADEAALATRCRAAGGMHESKDAVGQAFADAVDGGTGMFRVNPDGSTEHISPDQFKLAPPAKEKA